MNDETVPPGQLHPDEWQQDLNPDLEAGLNYGQRGPARDQQRRSASDITGAHVVLQGLSDDELRQIPVLPEGTRLEQGATYIDLRQEERREFTAMGGMVAGPDNWYVPKKEVDYRLWNRLIGVENPERLGEADET